MFMGCFTYFFAFEKWRMWMPFRNFVCGFAECGLGNDVC